MNLLKDFRSHDNEPIEDEIEAEPNYAQVDGVLEVSLDEQGRKAALVLWIKSLFFPCYQNSFVTISNISEVIVFVLVLHFIEHFYSLIIFGGSNIESWRFYAIEYQSKEADE
eukprot:CAMPEP_0114579448 /NCGR_PEP_ID=MMETSP0125-20121206/3812_1 /TAXON_ID=485358 ORGANISM="Aristerostoma sp., Strain ATCC 50986" /NCGR_SAMPLE_ID=MMETSP0125 /ASSEMBLY_ACC=CAM_ASM_000245 /LENGTH=111 /DNA_ID=CAMNT_0001770177 /DNA_START=562 /DNA_END=897 /DNA_ORIENTATION=-